MARINLAAIERNVATLRARLATGTELCAVVKADGYGHGAAPAARAARAGGATWLAVAAAAEAVQLREAGIDGRILIMGALHGDELTAALAAQSDVVAWEEGFLQALERHPGTEAVRVHVKLDTGMGRLGTRSLEQALAVADRVRRSPKLQLAGLMTHFATSDEDDTAFMDAQLARFDALRTALPGVPAHAANSAAVLRGRGTGLAMVRCGIGIYGLDPMNRDPAEHGLHPALTLWSYVAAVKPAEPGDSAGYGRRFIAQEPTTLATIPIGYGDGLRRAFTNNLEVLIRGRRHPVVGTVSMDNITVELGRSSDVQVGDAVILIGRRGAETVTAEELAQRIGTINYEITCGLTGRVRRVYHRDGEPA